MEQKAKKYEELNKYERAMTNASLEQRLEAMARDLEQIAKALKLSVHVDAGYYDWSDEGHAIVYLLGKGEGHIAKRELDNDGDLLGLIEEAKGKDEAKTTDETD